VVRDRDKEALAQLLQGLKSGDRKVFDRTRVQVIDLRVKDAGEVACLLDAADNPDEHARGAILMALYSAGRPLMPVLLEATKDRRPTARSIAVLALGQYRKKEESKVVVPVIIRALRDESSLVRREAAGALRCFPGEAEQVVPALVRALGDKDVAPGGYGFSVAACAAGSLEHLGPAAKAAVPDLLKALKSPKDKQTRHDIFLALGKAGAGDKDVIEALVRILKDKKEGEWRPAAAGALGLMGPKAKPAVPALVEVLKDSGETGAAAGALLRNSILYALEAMGPAAEPAIPALMDILRDKKTPRTELNNAVDVLGSIGPAAKEAAPLLREALKDKRLGVRDRARRALDKTGR
jgi:HEAT repeat protein